MVTCIAGKNSGLLFSTLWQQEKDELHEATACSFKSKEGFWVFKARELRLVPDLHALLLSATNFAILATYALLHDLN